VTGGQKPALRERLEVARDCARHLVAESLVLSTENQQLRQQHARALATLLHKTGPPEQLPPQNPSSSA
jgi:hypothetical protein